MKKKRVIPVLLLKNGWLVQSKDFSRHKNLGNPVTAVRRLSEWASDEVIYIDISRGDIYDLRRDDLNHPNRGNPLDILEDVAKATFMPITFGGRIRTLADIEARLVRGADKVSINTMAIEQPDFIDQAAREFGSQCIVVSIDVKTIDNQPIVVAEGGSRPTHLEPAAWAHIVEARGAGEILLNSVDRDGARTGYDIALLNSVVDTVKIPVIALGGCGVWDHFGEALDKTAVDAVAAANIFQYYDQSVYLAKKWLLDRGYNVRPPDLLLVE
jgi:cyclase